MMQYNGELTKEEKSLQKQKVMASGEWGRGNIEVWAWEVQTTESKIGSRMYCTTGGIEPVFCNNYKWKVTLKLYKNLKK